MISIFVLALGLMTVTASAKTKKLKNADFDTNTAKVSKKATTIKKGSYTFKFGSKHKGYLKFKAPKTATYTFTLSGLKSRKYNCGYWYIMTENSYNPAYISNNQVKTQGGSMYSLYYATKNSTYGEKKYRYLKSRYGKIKLSQGQTAYIYIFCTGAGTFNFKVK